MTLAFSEYSKQHALAVRVNWDTKLFLSGRHYDKLRFFYLTVICCRLMLLWRHTASVIR